MLMWMRLLNKSRQQIWKKNLKEEKKLQVSDVKLAEREEYRRSSNIDIEIDPDDYDLVDQDEIRVSDFSENELINYLESRGYDVLDKSYGIGVSTLERLARDLQDAQPYKLKDFLCDLLELSHMASKEDIINEMKSKI